MALANTSLIIIKLQQLWW